MYNCQDPGEKIPNRMTTKDLVELSEIILKFSSHHEFKEIVSNTIPNNFWSMPLDQADSIFQIEF
jgi:hypothetical protein